MAQGALDVGAQMLVEHSLGFLDGLRRLRRQALRERDRVGSSESAPTTWLASPIATASPAGMRSPVNKYCFAFMRLVIAGHVTALPSPATNATDTCGSARNAVSAMNTTSHSVAIVHPSPTAGPFTAPTIGSEVSIIASTISNGVVHALLAEVEVDPAALEVFVAAAGAERAAGAGEHDGAGISVGGDA